MFNESVEAQEQRFLTEGTSIDAQENVQPLSEEQQHWLRENLEEIKKVNDDTVPVHALFLNFSDYRKIDEKHYFLMGKIHERHQESEEDMKKAPARAHENYYLKETREWIETERYINHKDWDDMPEHLLADRILVSNVRASTMYHEDVVKMLKEERKKLKCKSKFLK